MNTTTHRPCTDAIHMARAYLAQARARRHFPAWHATLLRWAAKHRAEAMRERLGAAKSGQQIELI